MRFTFTDVTTRSGHLPRLAVAAEAAGYDGFTIPDSIAYPKHSAAVYPYTGDGDRNFLEGSTWPPSIRTIPEVLSERWGERPSAYLGITIPGYPNFFCMNGPGTWLASGGSLIFHSECQMRYITQCLEILIAGGHRTMEPTVEKTKDWHERSQAEMATMVWSQPTIKHSYFMNSFGEVHTLSPWRLVDYWTWTREPDPGNFVFA